VFINGGIFLFGKKFELFQFERSGVLFFDESVGEAGIGTGNVFAFIGLEY